MDWREGVRRSADLDDDAFEHSMARLSTHLATRQTTLPVLPPYLPARRPRTRWPLLLLPAAAAVGLVGYYHADLLDDDLLRVTQPQIAEATIASPAPTPVRAAILVPPDPATSQLPALAANPAAANPEGAIPANEPPPPVQDVAQPGEAAATAQPDLALSLDEVLEVQTRLVTLGINPGPLDGVIGPRTIAAVQRYEEMRSRPVSARLDRRLLQLLQQEVGPKSTLDARAH